MKIKLEVLVSITAMITAVAAVVVAIIQTQLMREEAELEREHSRLSVQPVLSIYSRSSINDTTGEFAFGIRNEGLGPAVVEGFSVAYKGTRANNWSELVAIATDGAVHLRGEKRNVPGITESTINKGMLVPADSTILAIKLDSDAKVATRLRKIDQDTTVSICYCSLYKECWVTTSQNTRAKSVTSCKAYESVNFNQLDSIQ
ncbi:hypothetical protein [Aliikangiella coralliicola]|uniref:Uncharacterized protein n=1 Tax=Aliikangiella coralliicola TaxID=2592383 RepID=A0A545UEY1_9GAMM|nr:hypothetical protein [Aliikangiella coralliicola]TQV88029.1 hypothetical protein FLL46_09470 [Aliikangiella coralliicola]